MKTPHRSLAEKKSLKIKIKKKEQKNPTIVLSKFPRFI